MRSATIDINDSFKRKLDTDRDIFRLLRENLKFYQNT